MNPDTGLPPPLVPPEVDLRDFTFMPLEVRRLRDSALIAERSSDEVLGALLLWCASWHQLPASSLPDDDRQLANLAGYGRAVNEFKRIRDGALHRWIRCSDGRWYHPVVAEKAADAWNGKLREAWRRACDNVRKLNNDRKERNEDPLPKPAAPAYLIAQKSDGMTLWRYGISARKEPTIPRNPPPIPSEGNADSGGNADDGRGNSSLKGEGQGQGEGQGDCTSTPAHDPQFTPLVEWLSTRGLHPYQARNFMALVRKSYGDEIALATFHDAKRLDVTKPIPWVKKALELRAKGGNRANRQEQLEERNRQATQDWKPPEVRDGA